MDEQLKIINKCYINLEYGIDKEGAEVKISALAEKIKFTKSNNFSERFLEVASVIKDNLSLFKAACEHPDVITTIIEYLNYFGMKLSKEDDEEQMYRTSFLVILTLLEICNLKMQLFLKNTIMKNSPLEDFLQAEPIALMYEKRNCGNEMILFGDADLYAVIKCLRNITYPLSLSIKVQEPIKEKFVWLIREYLPDLSHHSEDFFTFRTKDELFTTVDSTQESILSIWTEDIIFAKNFAKLLDKDVIFINMYLDLYGGIVLLPYRIVDKLFEGSTINVEVFSKIFGSLAKDDSSTSSSTKELNNLLLKKNSVYHLFYDGMWQKPVNGTYWTYNDSQWANATSEDVTKCINSAKKGFKIWSNKSIAYRMEILSKFASMLKCFNKSELADIVSQLVTFSSNYKNNLCWVSQSEKLEITKIRKPRGVIILKEKDEKVLFAQLVQNLTVGNSVIVIYDKYFCSLVEYCNMFSTSNIPPGVINLLSSEDALELELFLFKIMDCAPYTQNFSEDDTEEEIYMRLTKAKRIIIPLE